MKNTNILNWNPNVCLVVINDLTFFTVSLYMMTYKNYANHTSWKFKLNESAVIKTYLIVKEMYCVFIKLQGKCLQKWNVICHDLQINNTIKCVNMLTEQISTTFISRILLNKILRPILQERSLFYLLRIKDRVKRFIKCGEFNFI